MSLFDHGEKGYMNNNLSIAIHSKAQILPGCVHYEMSMA